MASPVRCLPPMALALLGFTCLLLATQAVAGSAQPDSQRQQELRYLVQQDCGSCHGMTLKGGLGPALTPQALAGKPTDLLISAVLDGRPGTAMPPWGTFMTEPEGRWIVEQLVRGELGSDPGGPAR